MMTHRRWRVLSEPLHPPFDGTRAAELPILAAADADLMTADSIAEWMNMAPTADAVLHWRVPIGPREIDLLERCRVIAHYGVGVDRIDIQSAAGAGIYVTNVPRYGVAEVADHAMTLLLASARKLRALEQTLRTGGWGVNGSRPIYRLHGRTLGIIGLGRVCKYACRPTNGRVYARFRCPNEPAMPKNEPCGGSADPPEPICRHALGNIGSAVAVRAAGFGLRLLAYDPYLPGERFAAVGAERVDLSTVLATSDFLSLHLPLTDETRNLLGAREFGQMKPGVFLVNTSRGAVLDEGALLEALDAGIVAGAGLDVFHEEPLAAGSPLMRDERVIVTPHAAFFSEESIRDMQAGASEQVAAVFAGRRPPFAAALPGMDWAKADRRWNVGDSDR